MTELIQDMKIPVKSLFSTAKRERSDGSRYNEPAYSFLNTSAWPSVGRVREFWEDWFAPYDDDKKIGLAARFQSYDDHPHLSALLELFTFAILRRSGYEIDIEPPVGSKVLEFFASRGKHDPRFFVECTATGQRVAEASTDALEADALEAIDKVPAGPFLLRVEFLQHGPQAPPAKRLTSGLTSWLATLVHTTAVEKFHEANRFNEWTWAELG